MDPCDPEGAGSLIAGLNQDLAGDIAVEGQLSLTNPYYAGGMLLYQR